MSELYLNMNAVALYVQKLQSIYIWTLQGKKY